MNSQRLMITCGGTGGHFYPGLALARTHQEARKDVLLVLSGVNSESQRQIAESFGIRVVVLPQMPSPGKNPWRALRFLWGLIGGYFQSVREIADFRPDAVLGMGSFASLPVLLAARRERIAIYLHDGNARIGKANRKLSRFADFLGTALPPVNAAALSCPFEEVGMPVRPELLDFQQITREEAIQRLKERYGCKLEPEKKVLLVFGGSQGAATINSVIPVALRQWNHPDLQVIHLTGPRKFEEVSRFYEQLTTNVLLLPSCDAMELVYSAADLVIARAGGSTLAELALFGCPSVLVPYPYAAENHQWDNACAFVEAGAAITVPNAELTPERVVTILQDYEDHPDVWLQRGARALSMAKPDASRKMLEKMFGKSEKENLYEYRSAGRSEAEV